LILFIIVTCFHTLASVGQHYFLISFLDTGLINYFLLTICTKTEINFAGFLAKTWWRCRLQI